MFDTVTLRLSIGEASGASLLDMVTPRLSNLVISNRNGVPLANGAIGNMSVKVGRDLLRVTGSICKYFHGDNIAQMTRKDMKEAISRLSADMGVDLKGAQVERADIAVNIYIKKPLKLYSVFMGELEGAYKDTYGRGHGVSYRSKNARKRIAVIVYDKALEARKEMNRRELKGLRVLRCEMQIQSNKTLKVLLNRPSIRASDLYNSNVYQSLKTLFIEKIQRIKNMGDKKIRGEVLNTGDAMEKALSAYCHKYGVDYVVAEFESGTCKGAQPNESQRRAISRYRKRCMEAIKKYGETPNQDVEELKGAVIDAINRAK